MNRSIDRFLEVARSGDASRTFCPPQDAIRTLAVALACERALETGGRVASMTLKRIDHIGIVVDDLAAHVDQLEALGLDLGRTNDNSESHAEYFPCGDASVELIDVRDAAARARGCRPASRPGSSTSRSRSTSSCSEVRDLLEARGVEVSWPPFPSGDAMMIWTTAGPSGGVQYQFLRDRNP